MDTTVSVPKRETSVMLTFSYFGFGAFFVPPLSGVVPAHAGVLCGKVVVVGGGIRKGPVYLYCMTILM